MNQKFINRVNNMINSLNALAFFTEIISKEQYKNLQAEFWRGHRYTQDLRKSAWAPEFETMCSYKFNTSQCLPMAGTYLSSTQLM